MAKRLARLLLLSAALLAVRAQDDDVADEVEAAPAAAAPSPAFLVIAKASAPGLPLRRRADAPCAPQTVKEAPAVVGGNVTVTLQMFNAGERCAPRHQPWIAPRRTRQPQPLRRLPARRLAIPRHAALLRAPHARCGAGKRRTDGRGRRRSRLVRAALRRADAWRAASQPGG